MEISLKNFEILNMQEVLSTIAGQTLKDVKVAYRITKLLRKLGPHVEDFQKMRKELIDKWAKKDEKGNYIPSQDADGKEVKDSVQLSDSEAFNKDLVVLVNEEVAIQFGVTVRIEDLQAAGVTATPIQLAALEKLLDAEEVK